MQPISPISPTLRTSDLDRMVARAGKLRESNKVHQVIELLQPLVEQGSDDQVVLQFYFEALMLAGRLGDGWRVWERLSRQLWAGQDLPSIARARWSGEPLQGRSVVAYADQGLGDAIQHVRFVPKLRDAGVEVSIACPESLARLFRYSFPGVDVATTDGEAKADLLVPMSSLGCALELEDGLGLFAGGPYLQAPAGSIAIGGNAVRVGLAWAGNPCHGNDHIRSLRPRLLTPMLRVPGVTFVPLQMPFVEGPPPFPIDPASWSDQRHRIGDFLDTAELLAQLDLVITVDTSIAHLAGAMGIPTWILVPFVPDCRWQLDRIDSPWYPSVRLWRQAAPGDWETVIEQVALELGATVHRSRQASEAADGSNGPPGLAVPPCKCCGGLTRWFGAVSADYLTCVYAPADRSEGCFDYWRCESCRFLFCTHFDTWSDERMRTDLYNDEFYHLDDG